MKITIDLDHASPAVSAAILDLAERTGQAPGALLLAAAFETIIRAVESEGHLTRALELIEARAAAATARWKFEQLMGMLCSSKEANSAMIRFMHATAEATESKERQATARGVIRALHEARRTWLRRRLYRRQEQLTFPAIAA